MASSSISIVASANTNSCYNYYDVFINHRGPDVKKTFATDLYLALCKHGLRVFLDIEELLEGDKLKSQIESAIRTASVQIAIFSPGYALSSWCLNELLCMFDMLDWGSTILQVFYNVKPSDLRWANGLYAESLRSLQDEKIFDFQTHQEKPRYDSDNIEKWRKALYDAANICGFHLDSYNGDKGQLIDKVVQRVLERTEKIPLDVSRYPTGLEEKVQNLERTVLLQQQSRGARVVGIVGLGGVGKTTVAKEFLNLHISNYHRSCFLFDVRENAARGSLNSLQSKLLQDLTKSNKVQIYNTADGIAKLTRFLSSSHEVLIVLDDVDHVDHLNALLLPVKDVLHSGSLILVTSRRMDVLTSSDIPDSSIYRLTSLNRQQSQKLFCSHAFQQSHPVLGFEQEIDKFLDVCNGLPLSLKVLGALLRGKEDMAYWKAQLCEISEVLPADIHGSIKISYDSLNPREKQIFLDIACFFIGEDRDTAIRIWDGSSWCGWLGFRNLENKCLVDVDVKNRIRMHDHVRDLGRDMAKNEYGRCSLRLWRPTEDLNNQSPVRGIKNFAEFTRLVADTSRLQLLSAEGKSVESILRVSRSPQLVWLCWYNCTESSLPSWILMKNLRVLKINEDDLGLEALWQDESQVPLQLRELDIAATHLLKIPSSIGKLKHLEKIVLKPGKSDDMHLKTLPEEFCNLQSLKHLELNHCSRLKLLPDSFGNLTNLQHVMLLSLYSLERLPDSFGNLRNLQHINLSSCKKLDMLPESFGNYFPNLQLIDLSSCFNLEMLPKSFCKLTNLQHIDLSYCYTLKMRPNSQTFGNFRQLKYLNMKECMGLTISSETLGNITTLEFLCLPYCNHIEVLPPQVTHQRSLLELSLLCPGLKELSSDIRELSNLKRLRLGSKTFETLPESLGHLRSLEELELHFCDRLKCFPYSIRQLTQLKKLTMVKMANLALLGIEECPSSDQPPFRNVGAEIEILTDTRGRRGLHLCLNIQHLKIENCVQLVEIRALPTTLIKLELEGCSSLVKIRGLYGLAKLQTLKITLSQKLEVLPGIETLASLETLSLRDLKKLNRIQGLGQLKQLRTVDIIKCHELRELPSVEDARSLKKLTACECPKLQWGGGLKEQLRQRLQCFSVD